MCGIAGLIKPFQLRSEFDFDGVATRMAAALAHRGPDDLGTWVNVGDGVGLSHSRLSVIDTSETGHQPMVSASGRFVMGFNGELYNFRALRVGLERGGYPFLGESDTEVALASVEHHGLENSLERFVGMFAFYVWDREEKCLFLVCDRFGEKPIYYLSEDDSFVFGSELGAIRSGDKRSFEVDRNSLSLLLRYGYIPAPSTIFKTIKKITPGQVLRVRAEGQRLQIDARAYWSASGLIEEVDVPIEATSGALVSRLDAELRFVIADKLISDVPLGAFLSGGIDSSTIVAMMQAESEKAVRTFSIGFEEESYDEAPYARKVAEHLRTEHTELYVSSEQARGVIREIPRIYSEPFADSSQIPTYLLCKLARKHVTVALSGDGADEIFGGYNRYALGYQVWRKALRLPWVCRAALRYLLGRVPPRLLNDISGRLNPVLPSTMRVKQPGHKLQKLAGILDDAPQLAAYQHLVSLWTHPSDVVIGGNDPDILNLRDPVFGKMADFRHKMMFADLLTYLPNDILVKVDRASMACGMEVRAPYLDHRLVRLAWSLPIETKVRGGEGKWLLKQVLRRYVSAELTDRPKMGFGVPVDQWLRGPLRSWGDALLSEERLEDEGFFRSGPIVQRWRDHCDGKGDWQYALWPILMFQAWSEFYEVRGKL